MRLSRRRPEPPPRDPHPNARVEVQLQQVISLRTAAARNEATLDQHAAAVRRLTEMTTDHPTYDGHLRRISEIERVNREITRLNRETAELHGQVAEICAKLSDDDLLWLDMRRAPRR